MKTWRRVERMPIMYEEDVFAMQRYVVVALPGLSWFGASTIEEAQTIATRMRKTNAQIVTIARVEEAWKRQ